MLNTFVHNDQLRTDLSTIVILVIFLLLQGTLIKHNQISTCICVTVYEQL